MSRTDAAVGRCFSTHVGVVVFGSGLASAFADFDAITDRSSDDGQTWSSFTKPFNFLGRGTVKAQGALIAVGMEGSRFTCCFSGAIIRSLDHGATWGTTVRTGNSPGALNAVAAVGSVIVAVGESYRAEGGAVLRSTDAGATWAAIAAPPPVPLLGLTSTPDGTLIAVGTAGSYGTTGVVMAPHVFRSTDQGQTWSEMTLPTLPDPLASIPLSSVATSGSTIVAAGSAQSNEVFSVWTTSVVVSNDDGQTWQADPTPLTGFGAMAVVGTPTSLSLFGTSNGNADMAFRSADGGLTWTNTYLNSTANYTGLNGAARLTNGKILAIGDVATPLISSTDDGVTWTTAPPPSTNLIGGWGTIQET